MRERTLYKIYTEFLETARRGVVLIIEGNVPTLNPGDPFVNGLHVYQNIFFTLSTNGKESFANIGGEKAAHVAVNREVYGVDVISNLELGELNEQNGLIEGGLYCPLTAIIDYKGKRFVAQSLIPGVFRKDQASSVLYGAIEGKQVKNDPKIHSLLEKASNFLHFDNHA